MKKILKLICFFSLCFLVLKCNEVKAAQELTCIYDAGSIGGYMLIQDSFGSVKIRNNVYGNFKDMNDPEWSDLSDAKLKYDETESYDTNIKSFVSCPKIIYQQSEWHSYELLDSLSFWGNVGSIFFGVGKLIEPGYNYLPNEAERYKQFNEDDYTSEIQSMQNKKMCPYETMNLYFNDETFIIDKKDDNIFSISTNFSLNDYLNNYNKKEGCPNLYVELKTVGDFIYATYSLHKTNSSISEKKPTTSSTTTGSIYNIASPSDIVNCNSLLGNPDPNPSGNNTPAFYLVTAFRVIKYVAIILLIVLSVMDMTGAVASQDQDSVKKAGNKILKRFMLCIVIFLLPEIINLALKYFADKSLEYCNLNSYIH